LNAEGAKVAQSMQKRTTKKYKSEFTRPTNIMYFSNFGCFFLYLLLRPLRNLRAFCVQKLPVFEP
jgi:hypothetical protein